MKKVFKTAEQFLYDELSEDQLEYIKDMFGLKRRIIEIIETYAKEINND